MTRSCATHSDRTAEVVCTGCGAAVCADCRDPGAKLCLNCAISATARAVGKVVASAESAGHVTAPRRDSSFEWTVSVLFALQVAAGALWLGYRSTPAAEADSRLEAVAVLSQAVEDAREASGRLPESLASLPTPLPPETRRLVREGRLDYRPSPDRMDYEVILLPPGERDAHGETDAPSS